jgi:hypothetical protein
MSVCLLVYVRKNVFIYLKSIGVSIARPTPEDYRGEIERGEREREKGEKYRESKRTVRDGENLGINRKGRRDMAKTEQRGREC